MKYTFIFTLLFGLVTSASAQDVYKTTDEDGNVVYTDAPRDDAEKVEIEPLNIQESIDVPDKPKTDNAAEPKKPQYNIRLVSPTNGQRYGPANRTVQIAVELNRNLMKDYTITYYFDGQAVIRGTRSQTISIPIGVTKRGKRSVRASVIAPSGKAVASTSSATIHVIRP